MLPEDSYGRRKRFEFVATSIRAASPATVIDFGCGTGVNLTIPLARAFPEISIVGVDSDIASIAHACRHSHPPNLRFMATTDLSGSDRFDFVIASEVLEHVDDPANFLTRLGGLMHADGRMIVTVPNGYGPFELLSLLEVALNLSGLQRLLRSAKRLIVRTPGNEAGDMAAPTLAVSPHVNFYSRAALRRLFGEAGFSIARFRPTTFLCGYGIDSLIGRGSLAHWNARAADWLPPWCASDWMFELRANCASRKAASRPDAWRPNGWGRFRRRLNMRRWHLV